MADDSALGCVPMVLALVAAGWMWSSYSYPDYITVYQRVCIRSQPYEEFNKCAKRQGTTVYFLKRQFRVDYEHQRVFDISGIISRKDNCVVVDTSNWTCNTPSGIGNLSMNDGTLVESSSVAAIQQIPWYFYWLRSKY